MDDAQSHDLGNNLSYVLGDNTSQHEPAKHSEIASMRKMMEYQLVILNNAIQHNTEVCVQNAKLMKAKQE